MKRLHVHVSVEDLQQSLRFYTTLFAAPPTVEKPDYAKRMLDDPRLNFAISQRGAATGIEHLGIQVETEDELREVNTRLEVADRPVVAEGPTTCCYHHSEKSWISDPQGIAWEAFRTTGEATVYSDHSDSEAAANERCCTYATPQGVCCAPKHELPAEAACCGPVQGSAA